MTSAVPAGKKPAICRYFVSSGSCVYGDECQFLHENPLAFQQQSQKNVTSLLPGQNQRNGPINGPGNPGMTDQMGSNGDQYFNATFSTGEGHVPDFQPFSQRQKLPAPISRQPRTTSVGGVPGSGGMISAGALMTSSPLAQASNSSPMAPPMSQPNQMPSPFNPMTPNKVPISQSTPLPPQHMGPQGPPTSMPPTSMPLQNGPASIMNGQLPPNMKQFIGGGGFDGRTGPMFDTRNGPGFDNRNSGGFDNRSMVAYSDSRNGSGFDSRNGSGIDSNITNDFSALNLSVPGPTKQGTNPYVGEFIPKSLSHSSSSPNFSSFNTSQPPPGTLPNTTAPTNHIVGLSVNSTASPNHSPRLSPANSPLMMRRNGSPVTPLRNKAHPASTIQENVGGTTYFYNAEDFTAQREGISLPNFSMYQGQPAHIAHMKVKANMPQFFMPDELKMEILSKNALTMAQIDISHNIDIPSEVDTYQNLFPLEPPPENPHQKSKTFGYSTTCYKALNTKDGLTYCLRRIHGFRLVNTKCMTLVDMWKKMYHPNIVQLREVFTTKAFGDHSIVFVYDFFPGSETLLSRHFSQAPMQMNGFNGTIPADTPSRPFVPSAKASGSSAPRQHAGLLPESLIWAYVVQLSSSLRAIHAAGLSCRTLDPSKIIIYSKSRLRLNCCGIFDVLTYDNSQSNPMALTPHYQQEDLVSLGKVVLALACNSVMAIQRENLQTSMELVARNYSADLKNLILYLLSNQSRPRSINDIMPMIGARFYTQLDSAQLRTDVIENEMAKEVENGRLFRLLCKLGVTNERPEFNLDPQWSETGDRYMLKLFRDYVFHQVDENGAPWVDMSHVVHCLNKLDAASPEKISLMSRDEQNVLVVSYAELKQNIDNAFSDILNVTHQSAIS